MLITTKRGKIIDYDNLEKISKERYIELRGYLEKGANLPPINLTQMQDFEDDHGLMIPTKVPGVFAAAPIESL